MGFDMMDQLQIEYCAGIIFKKNIRTQWVVIQQFIDIMKTYDPIVRKYYTVSNFIELDIPMKTSKPIKMC
jgi:hypothetical protein